MKLTTMSVAVTLARMVVPVQRLPSTITNVLARPAGEEIDVRLDKTIVIRTLAPTLVLVLWLVSQIVIIVVVIVVVVR